MKEIEYPRFLFYKEYNKDYGKKISSGELLDVSKEDYDYYSEECYSKRIHPLNYDDFNNRQKLRKHKGLEQYCESIFVIKKITVINLEGMKKTIQSLKEESCKFFIDENEYSLAELNITKDDIVSFEDLKLECLDKNIVKDDRDKFIQELGI